MNEIEKIKTNNGFNTHSDKNIKSIIPLINDCIVIDDFY
jgi:hypothetical protein